MSIGGMRYFVGLIAKQRWTFTALVENDPFKKVQTIFRKLE